MGGGVAEWTKAAALKAVEGLVPSVGSNPTPSATPGMPGYKPAFPSFPLTPSAKVVTLPAIGDVSVHA